MTIQIQELKTSELKPWQDNPRINDHAVDAVARSIKTFGFNVPILCDQNLTIVAGHTRLKGAKKLGLEKVPVIILKMTDEQRKAFSIADNKTAEIADWDDSKLKEVLKGIDSQFEMNVLGFSEEEFERLFRKDVRYLEDFNFIPQPKPSWMLISAPFDVIAQIQSDLQKYMAKGAHIEVIDAN